jgi:hypothetical protein
MNIELLKLQENEKERFIKEIQAAFKKAAVEEFGDSGEEVIPREDVINSFNEEGAESYNIVCNGEIVGGTVLKICPETNINELQLLYIKVGNHSKGLGAAAWKAIEKLHSETKIWETVTPYFEKRNIHFYVNKCGFKIVEFYNPHNPDPHFADEDNTIQGGDYFFRFEKDMTKIKEA